MFDLAMDWTEWDIVQMAFHDASGHIVGNNMHYAGHNHSWHILYRPTSHVAHYMYKPAHFILFFYLRRSIFWNIALKICSVIPPAFGSNCAHGICLCAFANLIKTIQLRIFFPSCQGRWHPNSHTRMIWMAESEAPPVQDAWPNK